MQRLLHASGCERLDRDQRDIQRPTVGESLMARRRGLRRGIKKWKACTGQEPLFTPDSDWVAPNLSDLPSWQGISRIGLDTEGCDPTLTTLGPGVRREGFTCGISFAIEDGPAFYLPTRHKGGGNLDPYTSSST